jgi:hypothetical protein
MDDAAAGEGVDGACRENAQQQQKIPGITSGDLSFVPAWAREERLGPLGQRADELVLAAVADLAAGLAPAHVHDRAQRLAETVAAIDHGGTSSKLGLAPKRFMPLDNEAAGGAPDGVAADQPCRARKAR